MSGFLGIDVHAAPALIAELRRWAPGADAVSELVTQAEQLADLPVGVSLELDAIGADGRTMARAVAEACDELARHRLRLTPAAAGFVARPPWAGVGTGVAAARGAAWRRAAGGGASAFGRAGFGGAGFGGAAGEGVGGTLSGAEQRRVDDLVGAIRADVAAGFDPLAHHRDLNRLLDRATGDPAGPGRAWATSLLFAGLAGSQLAPLFSGGPTVLAGRIGHAMQRGLTPAEAELPALLFPAGYVDWHRLDALRTELQHEHHGRSMAWHSIVRDRSPGGLATAELERLRADPAAAELDRAGIDHLLRGGRWSDLDLRQRLHLASVVRNDLADLGRQIDRLDARLGKLRVETLGHATPIGAGGTLASFDALAAVASMPLRPPSPVVGGAMAHWLSGEGDGVELRDVERSAAHLAADTGAATAFFATLGPERAGRLLHDLQLVGNRLRPGGGDLATGGLARDLSVALGRASTSLPSGFAEAVIRAQPEPIGAVVAAIAPEVLFAHGDFDGGFLVAAAAASVAVHAGRVVPSPGDWREPRAGEPLDLVLDRVVDAGLAADLVRALDATGTTGSLIWGGSVVLGGGGRGLTRAGHAGARSQVLAQAGHDAEAGSIVIEVAGDRLDTLDAETAHGLSQLLAAQVPQHLHAAVDSPYFVAVRNVFAAGAGVELDLAVRATVLERLVAGFERAAPGWHHDAQQVGTFAGRVDGLKFVAFARDAAARDAAIESSALLVSGLTSGLGIATGLAGVAVTGGVALPLALTGVGASGAGWAAPMFLGDADHRLDLYRSGMVEALTVDRTGEAITLLAAAAAGAVSISGGSVRVLEADDGVPTTLSITAAARHDIEIDPEADDWVDEARRLLDDAGATIEIDPDYGKRPTGDALNLVGDAVFSDGYLAAFGQTVALEENR